MKTKLITCVLALALAGMHLAAQAEEENAVPCWMFTRIQNCIEVPLASMEEDNLAKAFSTPSDGTANIYIVRPYITSPRQTTELSLDGNKVGVLGPLTYAVLNVARGKHRISTLGNGQTDLEIEVEAGTVVFVQYSIRILFNTSTDTLKVIGEDDGRKRVSYSKKISSSSDTP
jgi:hypothetical protein